MRVFKIVAISIAALFLYACSHPIEIVGEGDVTSASGKRNCYLEDFQTAKAKCTKNYALGAYQEPYYAIPRAGWKFDRWVNYCANATPPNYDCSFNAPAEVVYQYWGQTVAPLKAVFTTCTPGAPGCGWAVGDMLTYQQIHWDFGGIGSQVLVAHYGAVYAADFGVIEIGLIGTAGFSMEFSGFAAVQDYLPTPGLPAALNRNYSNPTSSSSGAFGGEALALRLNVDFADAGHTGGAAGVRFGDLRLCGLALTGLNGTSVRDFLGLANTLLGGGSNGYMLVDVAELTALLNASFGGGGVSSFAQNHLVNGPCP